MLIGLKDIWNSFPLKDKIPYKEFDKEVKSILKVCRDEMVEGNKIKTPLGTFRVAEGICNFYKPRVDIVHSMELKKEILARGGIPYKAVKDENGKVIGDNGGEKFFVYFTKDSFFYITIGNKRVIYIEDKNFKFHPAASTLRLVRKKLQEDEVINISYGEN